jgi:hypothetical protein
VNTLLQMGVLDKIPRQGSIAVQELASEVQKNEEVLSMSSAAVHFPTVAQV